MTSKSKGEGSRKKTKQVQVLLVLPLQQAKPPPVSLASVPVPRELGRLIKPLPSFQPAIFTLLLDPLPDIFVIYTPAFLSVEHIFLAASNSSSGFLLKGEGAGGGG